MVSAAYSASQVLCAVTVCFFDHHAMGESLIKKRIPEVPFEELILPQLLSEDAVSSMLPFFGKNRDADFVRDI